MKAARNRKRIKAARSEKSVRAPADAGRVDREPLREATDEEGEKWFSQNLPQENKWSLLVALRQLKGSEAVNDLIKGIRELANREELTHPEMGLFNLAILIEMAVWRFEFLVRDGVFDHVLPRLAGLPILYSPRNGNGAANWKMAKRLFEAKRVATMAPTQHHGMEGAVARRMDYGVAAAQIARLLRYAGMELPAFKSIRETASAVWSQTLQRQSNSEPVTIRWYYCGDRLLRWPPWLDHCEYLPWERNEVPADFRKAAEGLLAEFFAIPDNKMAERWVGLSARDSGYSQGVAETKRRVLEALDRL